MYAFPKKYGEALTISPVVVANGIEARLIQAEAALRRKDFTEWSQQLNKPRILYAPELGLLTDPRDSVERINRTFQERAAWLFFTGHRLGDLRRLIREYGRSQNQVFPIGPIVPASKIRFGNDISIPVPLQERSNPLFSGCFKERT